MRSRLSISQQNHFLSEKERRFCCIKKIQHLLAFLNVNNNLNSTWSTEDTPTPHHLMQSCCIISFNFYFFFVLLWANNIYILVIVTHVQQPIWKTESPQRKDTLLLLKLTPEGSQKAIVIHSGISRLEKGILFCCCPRHPAEKTATHNLVCSEKTRNNIAL